MDIHEVELLVDSTIEEFRHYDLDPYRTQAEFDETPYYLMAHRHEYIRTLKDFIGFTERNKVEQVLEIGAFFGVVSICIAKLGFRVTAADIPEYMSLEEQQKRFGLHGIEIAEARLEDFVLPFEDNRFDVVIMCEVLEHLNFNPLPLIKEINRVGANGSLFYLSLPNLAQLANRTKLVRGVSNLTPIDSYFNQLDPNELEIVNGHWREYTASEIREILERMGYGIEHQYYFSSGETVEARSLRKFLGKLFYATFPSLKENQTTLAIKQERTQTVFRIPKTVHRTLETL